MISIPDGYTPISSVFYPMVIAVAKAENNANWPELPSELIQSIGGYLGSQAEYDYRTQVNEVLKSRVSTSQKGLNRIETPTEYELPPLPICTTEVRDALNAIAGNGINLADYEPVVCRYLEPGMISQFVVDEKGMLHQEIWSQSVYGIWASFYKSVPKKPGVLNPVLVKDSDVSQFLKDEHARDKKITRHELILQYAQSRIPPRPIDGDNGQASIHEPSRTGLGRKYDWASAYREVIRIANQPDGLPEKKADLEEHLAQWFSNEYNMIPAETSLKDFVRDIYGTLKK